MSRQKPYIISLAVSGPGGRRFDYECEVTPIGVSDTNLDLLWMQLLASLKVHLDMESLGVVGSSQRFQAAGPKS